MDFLHSNLVSCCDTFFSRNGAEVATGANDFFLI